MCFVLIDSEYKLAKRDITVYKVGNIWNNIFISQFFPFEYTKGVLYEKDAEIAIYEATKIPHYNVPYNPSNFDNKIFHTYSDWTHLDTISQFKIGEFKIPKGSVYWISFDNREIATTKLIYEKEFPMYTYFQHLHNTRRFHIMDYPDLLEFPRLGIADLEHDFGDFPDIKIE